MPAEDSHVIIKDANRALDKSAWVQNWKLIFFFIDQNMLWVLERTSSILNEKVLLSTQNKC